MINSNPKILFLCPSFKIPIGGVKQIYRQVDVLNALGYNAFILHPDINSGERWFKNNTKVVFNKSAFYNTSSNTKLNFKGKIHRFLSLSFTKTRKNIYNFYKPLSSFETQIQSSDILVYPEVYAHKVHLNFPENKFVIYVQECFLIFRDKSQNKDPYLDNNLLGVMVNSHYGKSYINFAYPQIKTEIIRHSIDSGMFRKTAKKKQIALMSRKLPGDAEQIMNLFEDSAHSTSWVIVDINEEIETNTLQDVANTLSESAIFINLASTEGFGLPAVEAMSSGCLVLGYTGLGGAEYMNQNNSFPIPERDVLKLVQKLFNLVKSIESKNQDYYTEIIQRGQLFVSGTYNDENEKNDLNEFWSSITF